MIAHEGTREKKMCEESVPLYATVKRWASSFKRGRESLEDDPHAGCPAELTAEEM